VKKYSVFCGEELNFFTKFGRMSIFKRFVTLHSNTRSMNNKNTIVDRIEYRQH